MGVEELTEEEFPVHLDATVQELINKHGKEATRRGLKYMISLSEAERSYKQSANPEKSEEFIRETAKGVSADPGNLGEDAQEAQSSWEEGMRKNGLGLNDDG